MSLVGFSTSAKCGIFDLLKNWISSHEFSVKTSRGGGFSGPTRGVGERGQNGKLLTAETRVKDANFSLRNISGFWFFSHLNYVPKKSFFGPKTCRPIWLIFSSESNLESGSQPVQFSSVPKSALPERIIRRWAPQNGNTRWAAILKRLFSVSKAPYDASWKVVQNETHRHSLFWGPAS